MVMQQLCQCVLIAWNLFGPLYNEKHGRGVLNGCNRLISVCVCVCDMEVEKVFSILIGWMNKAIDVYRDIGFNSFYG